MKTLRKHKEAMKSKVKEFESKMENLDAQLPALNEEMESLNEQLSINKEILETLKRQAAMALEESDKLEEEIYEMQTKQEREESEWKSTFGKYDDEIEKLRDHREFRCMPSLFQLILCPRTPRAAKVFSKLRNTFSKKTSPQLSTGDLLTSRRFERKLKGGKMPRKETSIKKPESMKKWFVGFERK